MMPSFVAVLGVSWPEFISDWCLGQQPSIPPSKVNLALDALWRLWPEYLETHLVGRGLGPIELALYDGLILADCERLPGFGGVLQRLKAGEYPAKVELTFASGLVRVGYNPVLEPHLLGKRPDTAVQVNGETIYAEVIKPDTSDELKRMSNAIDALFEKHRGMDLTVLVHCDLTPANSGKIYEFASKVPEGETQELEELATVTRRRPNDGSSGRVHTSFTHGITDDRAKRLLSGEIHHLDKNATNLLVVNATSVPGAFEHWPGLFERALQPTQNTRIAAIIMYEEAIIVAPVRQRWRIISNPHTGHPAPEDLLNRLRGLDESRYWGPRP